MRTPKPTVAASNEPSSNGSSSRSPWIHSIAGAFRRGALEHRRREVEPDHLARAGRRAAIARSPVPQQPSSTRSPGRDDLAHRQAAPALVEADGHDAVHQVVDRRDPVEHRPDALGGRACRIRGSLAPPRPRACCRARAGRGSARRRSRRGRRSSRRRGRSRARRRGSRRPPAAASRARSGGSSESGVSRGTSTSLRSSFSATDAARWIRFAIAPAASVPTVHIEHGQTTYASTFAEPRGVRRSCSR